MVRTAQIDQVGRTLGDFEVRERISTGGMGTVYKAYQRGMNRLVAIKVLPPELALHPVALQRFYQEARSAARLDHPNIVRAITVGEQDGLHYFAMEFIEGESVARRIKREDRLPEAEAIRIVVAVGEALEAAHDKGVIHRDVKPENVLLTHDGQVKLADFGLVKRLDQDLGLTEIGKGLGTTCYMAPEQFKDAKHVDARCDIYSLGVLLHTALTGIVPWQGLDPLATYKQKLSVDLPPVRDLCPEISARTESVIVRATQVDRTKRYASCSEFLSELEGKHRDSRSKPIEDQLTRPVVDISSASAGPPAGSVPEDVWFIRFFEGGQRRQLKLRANEIRQGVRSGRLAAGMRVSRSVQGPWLHLSAFTEFTDLVAQLTRNSEAIEMESDIERTVAALHAGAPLRRRERNWGWLIWVGLIAIVVSGFAYWLLNR